MPDSQTTMYPSLVGKCDGNVTVCEPARSWKPEASGCSENHGVGSCTRGAKGKRLTDVEVLVGIVTLEIAQHEHTFVVRISRDR
jgi:hypothetical protein